MKKEISGPLGMIIAAAAVIGLLVAGYFMFLKGPGEVSPEETRRQMQQNMGGGTRPGGGGQPMGGGTSGR